MMGSMRPLPVVRCPWPPPQDARPYGPIRLSMGTWRLSLRPTLSLESGLRLRHRQPMAVAEQAPMRSGVLLPGARELLRITAEAWAPLHKSDAVPMPLVIRKRWKKLRESYQRQSGRGYIDAENQEWFSLPQEMRMAILLVAKIDGNLQELAGRDMRETPAMERQAIKAVSRSMKRHAGRLVALTSLW